MRRKLSTMYREAAKTIAKEGGFSCVAVQAAEHPGDRWPAYYRTPAVGAYINLFQEPREGYKGTEALKYQARDFTKAVSHIDLSERNGVRELMLGFAAAAAAYEGN